ncbi:MAG TPA: hypothetical protein VF476_03565 [Chitinophagaceae bacterium]
MKSFTRGLAGVVEVFFPVVVFCLALSLQLFRNDHKKSFSIRENKELIDEKTPAIAHVCKHKEPSTYLLFEQLTR